MTITDPTTVALFAAVRRAPDDDTLRLALADRLDELDAPSVPCPTCSPYADDPCPRCDGRRKHYKCQRCRTVFIYTNKYSDCGSPRCEGEESDEVLCPECNGTGKFPPGYVPARDPASGRAEGGWTDCKTCNENLGGTPGVVIDTVYRDRAALIRAQVELAKYPPTSENIVNDAGLCLGASVRVVLPDEKELAARAEALIAANDRRWRQGAKCERCRQRSSTSKPIPGCPVCRGTGDIGGLMQKFHDPTLWHYGIDYHGGTARVHVADLAECVREKTVPAEYECKVCCATPDETGCVEHGKGCYRVSEDGGGTEYVETTTRTVPSDWLLSVVRAHPDVLEVWVENRVPARSDDRWFWVRADPTLPACVPAPVFDRLVEQVCPDKPNTNFVPFGTEDAARLALARALVIWAHDYAKENRA